MISAARRAHRRTASGTALVQGVQLAVGYGGTALAPPIELRIEPGQFILVVGRNGSGKSTLARTLVGLQPAVSGQVVWRAGVRATYVPQVVTLDIAPMRVRDVARWGTQWGWDFLRPWSTKAQAALVEASLAAVGMAARGAQRFGELSGGQQQRVLLARMLASGAELAVLDEPTASMDSTAEREAFGQIRELARQRGLGTVVISHAVAAAAPFADIIIFFDPDAPGGPRVQAGPLATIAALPRFVAQFGRIDGEPHGHE